MELPHLVLFVTSTTYFNRLISLYFFFFQNTASPWASFVAVPMSGRNTSSYDVTTSAPGDSSPAAFRSAGLIALIVLASLCAILGAIYAYIYYTRINPRSARARKFMESNNQDDDENKVTHTHLFLFRK